MADRFTKKQIMDLANLKAHQVQFFTEQGVITPDVDPGGGRGHVRRYTIENLFEFLILAEMLKLKIKIVNIRMTLSLLRQGNEIKEWRDLTDDSYLILFTKSDGGVSKSLLRWGNIEDNSILTREDMKKWDNSIIIKLERPVKILREAAI